MIIGIGHDIVDTKRIERLIKRFKKRFIQRCFTENEVNRANQKSSPQQQALSYAKRYAAKEACAKALGTGIANGITFQDFNVSNNDLGKPEITLKNRALEILESKIQPATNYKIHISLSDEPPHASAYVIIETL